MSKRNGKFLNWNWAEDHVEIEMKRHDSDCEIYRCHVCTCGHLHRILPLITEWTEKDGDEMTMHGMVLDIIAGIDGKLKMPPPLSEEEIQVFREEFEKVWIQMGGTIEKEE